MIKEELDYKNLLKNPIKLFGYTYFYVFVILLGLGIYFVSNLTEMAKNKVIPTITNSTNVKEDLPMLHPSNIPPVDISTISVPTPELLEKGKILYKNNCGSCHGEEGKGDGAAGLVMNPKPRNLTANTGWVNGQKISEIYKTLDEGMLKTGMPSFNYLSAEGRFFLIHYVRSFSKALPKDSNEELQMLNYTYKLVEGQTTSAQIPVKVAEKIVVEENKANLEKSMRILESLNNISTAAGNEVFKRVCVDKNLVAGLLSSNLFKQKNKSEIFQIIASAPLNYGLSPKFVLLNLTDWDALYNYLNKLTENTRG